MQEIREMTRNYAQNQLRLIFINCASPQRRQSGDQTQSWKLMLRADPGK
jgi:hypothetical protein